MKKKIPPFNLSKDVFMSAIGNHPEHVKEKMKLELEIKTLKEKNIELTRDLIFLFVFSIGMLITLIFLLFTTN